MITLKIRLPLRNPSRPGCIRSHPTIPNHISASMSFHSALGSDSPMAASLSGQVEGTSGLSASGASRASVKVFPLLLQLFISSFSGCHVPGHIHGLKASFFSPPGTFCWGRNLASEDLPQAPLLIVPKTQPKFSVEHPLPAPLLLHLHYPVLQAPVLFHGAFLRTHEQISSHIPAV